MHKTSPLTLLSVAVFFSITSAVHAQPSGSAQPDTKMTGAAQSQSEAGGGLFSPNLYDGSCNINIPIYQYSAQGNDFGISLGYNTRGVKVDEIASDVGLHFNVSAGASIVRVMKDIPDEIIVEADTMVYASILVGGSYVDDTIPINPYYKFKGRFIANSETPGQAADPKVYRDQEADDFIVSMGGRTFTFNFSKDGSIFTMPKQNVKIQPLIDGSATFSSLNDTLVGASRTKKVLSFLITDEGGNRYYFRRGGHENKAQEDEHGQTKPLNSYWLTNDWVIDKVVFSTGAIISYNYTDELLVGIKIVYSRNHYLNEGTAESLPAPANITMGASYYKPFLSSVNYPNGVTASFIYDSRIRDDYPHGALRKINITSGNNCLNYVMDQSFFYATADKEKPYGDCLDGYSSVGPYYWLFDTKARLKLNAIRITNCDSTFIEPYFSFAYDTTALPERLSGSQDYFGYFNGATPDQIACETCLPNTDQYLNIPYHVRLDNPYVDYGVNKASNSQKMKAAILKEVTSAYGGKTIFYYTPNSLIYSPLSGLPIDGLFFGKDAGDGLRVDSIRETDPWHPENIKTTIFQYDNGQLFLTGGYYHYPKRTGTHAETTFNGLCLSQHHFINGSNHGYSMVSVQVRNQAGEQLSKKEYTFTNFSDATSGWQPRYLRTKGGKHYYQYPYTDKQYIRDWEMGLPLTITDYDQNDKLTMQVTNKYSFTLDTATAIGNIENRKRARLDYYPNVRDTTDDYRPYRGLAFLDTVITLKYISDTRTITDTIWYSYDSRNNLKNTITRNSRGRKIKSVNVYNYDVNALSGSTLYNMTQAGLEKVVGKQRWQIGTGGFSTDSLLDGFISTFTYSGGNVLPKAGFNLQVSQPVSYPNYTGWTSGPALHYPNDNIITAFGGNAPAYYKKASEVLSGDLKNNVLESQVNGQSQYVAMVWDTISGKKIAEAANCRYAEIGYTSFENTDPGPYGTTLVTHGNFTYYANQIANQTTTIKAPTGDKFYKLTASNYQDITGSQNLVAGKEYIISFWAKGATPRLFASGDAVSLSGTNLYTADGNWKHYLVRFTPVTAGKVKLSGPAAATTMYFDEIRLFPADATMNSWTYTPLFGASSSTDATGRITYYEYDKMGRQNLILNQERHILSKTEYIINGAE